MMLALSVLAIAGLGDGVAHGLRLGGGAATSYRLLEPPLERGLYDDGSLGEVAHPDTLVITRSNATGPALGRAAFRPAAPPRVIVQYGLKRTATTLQFQSLCATMLLLHGANSDRVECFFLNDPDFRRLGPLDAAGESRYYVLKTHNASNARRALQMYAPGEVWLFVTTQNATSTKAGVDDWRPTAAEAADRLGADVDYAQDVYSLRLRGYMIVADYMYLFGLSQDQSDGLFQYDRYWSILRQCCGIQMSKDQFSVMHGTTPTHHSPESPSYPACHIYDLSAVESELLHSKLLQRPSSKIPAQLRRASDRDDDFTGTYCAWYYRQVVCQNLQWDQTPQKPGC